MCDFEDVPMQTTPLKTVSLSCPKCQADLTRQEAIDNVRSGVQKNSLSFNPTHNWFDASEYEFESDGIYEEYTCAKCTRMLQKQLKTIFEPLPFPPIQIWGEIARAS